MLPNVRCAFKTRRVPYNSSLHGLKETDYPLERLHLDFCHVSGPTYLVALDAFSNFVNMKRSHSTSVNDVICSLLNLFKFLGLPTFIVTDSASCFTGDVFREFLERHGIHHILTPPYHSQSNGAAERVIASFKHFISKNGDIPFVEHMFCFSHNFMPLATTFYPSAKEVLALEAKTHMPRQNDIWLNNKHQEVWHPAIAYDSPQSSSTTTAVDNSPPTVVHNSVQQPRRLARSSQPPERFFTPRREM